MKEGVNSAETKVLDLRGIKCPTTYAYAKIELERMEPGEVLEIMVYRESVAENLVKTMEKEGNRVLSVKKTKHDNESVWVIRVRKI